MSEQNIEHDVFEMYLFKRLFPFIGKYKYLLIGGAVIIALAFGAAGVHSIYKEKQKNAVLDDIFNTLAAKKEVTPEVLQELNRKYADHPASLEVKWVLAGKYAELNDFENAGKVYQEILDISSDSPLILQTMLALGTCRENEGKYEDAIILYETCAARYSRNAELRLYTMYRKASAYFHQKKYSEAESVIGEIEVIRENQGGSAPSSMDDRIAMLKHRISINKK